MGHNPSVLPPGVLPAHYVLTPGRIEGLDQYASESLDGAGGGTFNPSSPIALGGAGLDLDGSCTFSGGVATGRGAVGVTLRTGAWPTFNGAARTRTVVVPFRLLSESDSFALRNAEQIYDPYGVRSRRTSQGTWFCAIPALRLHRGATLLSASLRWRSGAMPSALSWTGMPLARLVRVKSSGMAATDYAPTNIAEMWKVGPRANSTAYALGAIVHATGGVQWNGSNGYTYRCVVAGTTAAAQPAMSTTVGANQVDGSVTWRVEYGHANPFLHYQSPPVPLSADVAAYHNDGLPQDLPIRVNMNATIDTDNYEYRLDLAEPGGAAGVSFGNIYHSLRLTIGNITQLREP